MIKGFSFFSQHSHFHISEIKVRGMILQVNKMLSFGKSSDGFDRIK